MKCFDPKDAANFEAFHHISPPVCPAVKMGANGVINKLDADICKLYESLKGTNHALAAHPVRDDQEYASSQKFQITEAPKILMLHLKRTTSTKTIASSSL